MKEKNQSKQLLKMAKKVIKDSNLYTNDQIISYYYFFKNVLKLEEEKYYYKITLIQDFMDQLPDIQREILVKLYNLDGNGFHSYQDLSQEKRLIISKILTAKKLAIHEILLYMWKTSCKRKFVATLENIGLKNRTYHSLIDSGIKTVPELLQYTEEQLKNKCISLGEKSIEDINERLSLYGLYLKDHVNDTGENLTLENMGLENRSYHALINNKIITVQQLVSKSEIELLNDCMYIGEKSIKDIKERLHHYGLQLMDPKNKSIDTLKVIELQLSRRTINALQKEGIKTAEKLITYTEEMLYECKGINKVSVNEIKEALAIFHLSLRKEK